MLYPLSYARLEASYPRARRAKPYTGPMPLTVARVAGLSGELRPPSDKSLTHRALMLAAGATGESVVRRPLDSEDCLATRRCLEAMGLSVSGTGEALRLRPARSWNQPATPLDCGNSGTTMRLLAGLIAGRPISATLVGDASLSRRPMRRIAEPLRLMGAEVEGDTPPLIVRGAPLHSITYDSTVASAQVKSCVLLAALLAEGETWITEPALSRDHTERMLGALGVELRRSVLAGDVLMPFEEDLHGPGGSEISQVTRIQVELEGGQTYGGFDMTVPGDISSAAFFAVGAAMLPGSRVTLSDVGTNPTRTGLLDLFDQCGVTWRAESPRSELGEPLADLHVEGGGTLRPFRIAGPLVPRLVDEIPVLAVLATACDGVSEVRDASELRVKESDRIETVAAGLRAMGAGVETFEDGLAVEGPVRLRGARIDAHGDHRIAMAFAIAGLSAEGPTTITGEESIATSFPRFEQELRRLAVT